MSHKIYWGKPKTHKKRVGKHFKNKKMKTKKISKKSLKSIKGGAAKLAEQTCIQICSGPTIDTVKCDPKVCTPASASSMDASM